MLTTTDWHQEDNKHTLLKVFERFAPEQRKLLSLAPDKIKAWQLYDMDTLKTWSKGRLAVIGDAAHPFLPCQICPEYVVVNVADTKQSSRKAEP